MEGTKESSASVANTRLPKLCPNMVKYGYLSASTHDLLFTSHHIFDSLFLGKESNLCKYMKVRFVSGMDMLNLSRAFAKIMSGAASVSPVYTTILESGIVKSIV